MVKVKHDITLEKPFIQRVDNIDAAPIDWKVLEKSWLGVCREIGRQRSAQYKEVEPGIVEMKKEKVKRLRIIRDELKSLLKKL